MVIRLINSLGYRSASDFLSWYLIASMKTHATFSAIAYLFCARFEVTRFVKEQEAVFCFDKTDINDAVMFGQ